MIIPSITIFRYISRNFLLNLLAIMLILLGIILVFSIIEIIRQTSGNPISFGLVVSIALLKMPYLGESILPTGILFSAIYTCWKLNRTSELIIMRSAGISAWQFLTPMLISAFVIGVISTAALNPISSVLLSEHDQLQKVYVEGDINLATISKTGIWLRQPTTDGYILIHSNKIEPKNWQMNNVIMLFFDNNDSFLKRVDSPNAYLRDKYWDVEQPLINDKVASSKPDYQLQISTELTSKKITESFADPQTIPFWGILDYIKVMEDTGFPTTSIYMHFHKLLSKPLLFISLILLAASFSMQPTRFNTTFYMITFGIAVGFGVFFVDSIMQAFGMSQKLPIILAAWSTAAIALLIGITSLLHLEDG